MKRMHSLVVLAALHAVVNAGWAVESVRVGAGFTQPLYVTAPAGDTERLFVVEKGGTIRILDLQTGTVNPTAFLTTSVSTDSERGLLGLAFHPDYATNGKFYVNLTNPLGNTEIREYTVSVDPNVADPLSQRLVLTYAQPQNNHNGGWVGFGPNDGYLYIMAGDGGGSDDNDDGHTAGTGNAQDITDNLLGKALRVDINGDDFPTDSNRNYAIPATNPFVGVTGDDEIWAYGLRNPWRASFDRATGDLYIGDVGQSAREEIDFQPANSTGGENYGWRLREGTIATPSGGVGGAPPPGNVEPIYDYTRGSGTFQGETVTGGYVYRGDLVPELQGTYFFGDFIDSHIWSFDYDGAEVTNLTDWTSVLNPGVGSFTSFSSFGEGGTGELYIVSLDGDIFQIVPEPGVVGLLAVGGLWLVFGLRRRGRTRMAG
jgi:glucose/arabinose dehydrogenase